jgi:hypothetical protein
MASMVDGMVMGAGPIPLGFSVSLQDSVTWAPVSHFESGLDRAALGQLGTTFT